MHLREFKGLRTLKGLGFRARGSGSIGLMVSGSGSRVFKFPVQVLSSRALGVGVLLHSDPGKPKPSTLNPKPLTLNPLSQGTQEMPRHAWGPPGLRIPLGFRVLDLGFWVLGFWGFAVFGGVEVLVLGFWVCREQKSPERSNATCFVPPSDCAQINLSL